MKVHVVIYTDSGTIEDVYAFRDLGYAQDKCDEIAQDEDYKNYDAWMADDTGHEDRDLLLFEVEVK